MNNPRSVASEREVDADVINRLLGDTPFLNLGYLFGVHLNDLEKHVNDRLVEADEPILDYKQYKELCQNPSSELARLARDRMTVSGPEDELFDELIIFAYFLLQLPDNEFTTAHLDELLSRFEHYLRTGLESVRLHLSFARSPDGPAWLLPF
jgi:hypothetical protein